MALNVVTIKLKWENEKSFEMTEDATGEVISIIKVEENGHISNIWPQIKTICTNYFGIQMDKIGVEMALPKE